MASVSLRHVLRALPKNRLRLLEKFIRSPYHVTHPGVPELFAEFQAGLDAPETALPADDPATRRRYHLSSYLLEAVEKFLALERWEEQEHRRHCATVEGLRRLGLAEAGAAMHRYARKRLETDGHRGGEYHRAEYRLHLEAYYLSLQQGRAKTFNLQEVSDAQDIAFIAEKLRTGCMLLSHQAVAKTSYNTGLLEPILTFLDGHVYLDIPAVAVYYHGYYALLGENSDLHFHRLKALLETHGGKFSAAEVHDLYLMAINFGIRRINQSEDRYFRELFELYRSGLHHGALLENGRLSRWTYTNITGTALRLREFDWVHRFLQTYADYLPVDHRGGTVHFNMARYYYDTGRYDQAMHHLLHMDYDDVLHSLMAKVMLCKIYYERDETAALENQLDSIQVYLRRKKVLGYHRDLYTKTVRLMRKLLNLPMLNTAEREALHQEIEHAPALTERDWLLRQVKNAGS